MNRTIAIPIFLLIIFLMVVYGLVPKYNQFSRLDASIDLKEKQFSQAQKDLIVLEQAVEALNNNQESWDKIDTALPEDFSLASLLYYLDEQAGVNGLIMESIGQDDSSSQGARSKARLSEKETPTGIEESILSVNLIGAVSSLESFLRNIEKSSRLIRVESINTSETEDGLLRFGLSLKVSHY